MEPVALDLVEELRLRRWARVNFVPREARQADWHAVVHDEMSRRDSELRVDEPCRRRDIVPLAPHAFPTEVCQLLLREQAPQSAASELLEMHYQ